MMHLPGWAEAWEPEKQSSLPEKEVVVASIYASPGRVASEELALPVEFRAHKAENGPPRIA